MKQYINDAVIWINTDKNGKKYLSFKAERDIKKGESINLFKNNKDGVESRPDYRAFRVIEEEQDNLEVAREALMSDEEVEDINDEVPFN